MSGFNEHEDNYILLQKNRMDSLFVVDHWNWTPIYTQTYFLHISMFAGNLL